MRLEELQEQHDALAAAAASRFLNPFLQLALNGLLVTASEILLKKGAMATAQIAAPEWLLPLGVTALSSWWTWAGVATYILSFVNWLYILKSVPLSIAFSLASVVHILIPLGAWVYLGERVTPIRWCGILLIMGGIWLIAKSLVQAEEAI